MEIIWHKKRLWYSLAKYVLGWVSSNSHIAFEKIIIKPPMKCWLERMVMRIYEINVNILLNITNQVVLSDKWSIDIHLYLAEIQPLNQWIWFDVKIYRIRLFLHPWYKKWFSSDSIFTYLSSIDKCSGPFIYRWAKIIFAGKLRNPYFCHIFGKERNFFCWKRVCISLAQDWNLA